MLRRTFCLGLLFATFFSPIASAQNLLVNGSFDAGNFVPNGDATMSLNPGSTAITGWTTISAELAWIDNANPFSVSASDGSKHLDLAGYHDSAPYGGVEQSIATEIGKRYVMEFDLGTNPVLYGNTQSLTATAGSTSSLFTINVSGSEQQYQRFSLDFTATTDSTLISFVGVAPSGNHIALDNIAVTAVPAPSALAAFVIGAVPGAVLVLRRRRKA